MRMLAPALRWNVRDRAFKNFQQRLLHAFAGNVEGDRRIFVFAANLVDLIDVDDALLRAFDVAVRGLQKFQNDVLNVFADIACFCQRRRVDDGEWDAQHAGERLCQQSFARTRWPDQNDIGFLNLNIRPSARQFYSLVMLIDGDRQTLLGFVLADDVLVEKILDFAGFWQRRSRGYRFSLLIVGDDLVADVNALIADVNGGTGDELLDFILRLAAKRAAQRVIGSSYHSLGNSVRLQEITSVIRGARSPRLLNHIPWLGWRTSTYRAQRPVRSVRDFARYASPESVKSVHVCE